MMRVAFLAAALPLAAWATDEYPRVVHRDGQMCMQSLDESGQVKEECLKEGRTPERVSQGQSSSRSRSTAFR